MARKTIKLPEDDYERHNEQRQEMGLSWAEYIDGESPDLESMIRRVVRDELDAAGNVGKSERNVNGGSDE